MELQSGKVVCRKVKKFQQSDKKPEEKGLSGRGKDDAFQPCLRIFSFYYMKRTFRKAVVRGNENFVFVSIFRNFFELSLIVRRDEYAVPEAAVFFNHRHSCFPCR